MLDNKFPHAASMRDVKLKAGKNDVQGNGSQLTAQKCSKYVKHFVLNHCTCIKSVKDFKPKSLSMRQDCNDKMLNLAYASSNISLNYNVFIVHQI